MLTENIRKILRTAKSKKASDVHICVGAPVTCRVGKDLLPISDKPLSSDLSRKLAYELLSQEQVHQFESLLDFDLMLADDEGRYRVNINYKRWKRRSDHPHLAGRTQKRSNSFACRRSSMN